MAKSKSSSGKSRDNKTIMIILIVLVAFAAGFLIARAKYKAQLKTTYEMVMDREGKISDLGERIKDFQKSMMMQQDSNTEY